MGHTFQNESPRVPCHGANGYRYCTTNIHRYPPLSRKFLSQNLQNRHKLIFPPLWRRRRRRGMAWEEEVELEEEGFQFDFDFFSLSSKPKDYYQVLEVDYDATEDDIRSNYIRLALKWHPDKQKDEDSATSRFQEINEAYKVLADPVKRSEYDRSRILHVQDYSVVEYLHQFKSLILTCNGLGIRHSLW